MYTLMNTSFLSSLAWPIAIFSLAGLAYFLWRSWANEVGLRLNLQSYVAFRELLLDSMQEGFLAYDLEGHVKIVSESYTRISGWKAEEIIGSSGYERVAPGETPTLAELQARLIGHPNENLSSAIISIVKMDKAWPSAPICVLSPMVCRDTKGPASSP